MVPSQEGLDPQKATAESETDTVLQMDNYLKNMVNIQNCQKNEKKKRKLRKMNSHNLSETKFFKQHVLILQKYAKRTITGAAVYRSPQ